MKKLLIYLSLLLLIFTTPLVAKSNIKANEIYIKLDYLNQYLQIIEYNLVTTSKSKEVITKEATQLKASIKKVQYTQKKYNFKYFKAVEEELSREKSYIKGEYYLLTFDKNIKNLLQDIFEKLLDRKVSVNLNKKSINVIMDSTGLNFANNNAQGIYAKGNQRMISWKHNVVFELVVQFDVKNTTSLIDYIEANVSSPKLSKEEIYKIKNDSPKLNTILQAFQDDADIYRLRHIKYYGELLQRYYDKTGHYPFQGKEKLPIYTFIANDQQEKFTKTKNPNPHKLYPLSELIKELESTLGKKIKQYFDPQYYASKKPNFYIYMIRGDQYFFAVHISNYHDFATKVADNYYKVEISNKKIKGHNILKLNELLQNKKFQELIQTTPQKDGFFKEREAKYIHYIK